MIMVYDSLRRQKVPLVPIEPGHVRIYTCGVTPYASSHLGHARPAVIWDVIRRHLKRRGYLVTYVQNFTDIDDKIIRRAHEEHIAVTALAERHIREYEAMMAQLGVQPPDISPRVTDNIEEIIDFIQRLIAHGHAYAEQGDVYFAVRTDPQYGTLSGRQVEAMMDSGRIEPSPYKHAPEDFALWKASAPDEPGWDSPWGRGRPGWHIECSAMSCKYLGTRFDLHGGGVDLIFPHHENERAQSRAYSGQEPVSIWVHNGLITRGQVKMSKSLDNGAGLADLLRTFPPLVVRTYLLSVHYRSPLEFEPARLTAWQTAMQRLWHFWAEVQTPSAPRQATGLAGFEALIEFEGRFLAALDDDFNTARALGDVFKMVQQARALMSGPGADDAKALARKNLQVADEILGLLPRESSAQAPGSASAWVQALVDLRERARTSKNYALADNLREVLAQMGYRIEDTRQGPVVVAANGLRTESGQTRERF